MQVLGLDIGGANLKAVSADGVAETVAFAVWRAPERLADELGRLLARFEPGGLVAVVMTAELADCFDTKADGVAAVLEAVEAVAPGRPVVCWQTGAEFVSPAVARSIPRLVAAANWHALATFAGRLASDGAAVLVDVGSTTSDLVPLLDGVPVPRGLTDRERLVAGELVYSGVTRTPACAVADHVPLADGDCPLASELFATMLDVYLLTGDLPEAPDDCATADGRPATRTAARGRLARLVCCDRSEVTDAELDHAARSLATAQHDRLNDALDRVLDNLDGTCRSVLVSGRGEFLAKRLVAGHAATAGLPVVSLSECFSTGVAEAACAYAVARLAAERVGNSGP